MSRVLAVDYGTKRIGLAVSDEGRVLASPLEVVTPKTAREPVSYIIKRATELGCSTIVVGMPYALDGSMSPMTRRAEAFAGKLEKAFSGEVVRLDERFTSKEAEAVLLAQDVSRAQRRRVVDKVAAAIILQTYLDMQSSR